MRIVSILILLTAKCYRFTDCNPLFCLSVYMNVSCITRYLSICIILIFSFFCCNCIFSLVLCFLVFLLFCLSFYLIISNRKNFFRPDICHIICRNISVYRCRLNCCSILICYLLYLISIFGSNFEAKTFSFCYFFCILIITIIGYIRFAAICIHYLDSTAVHITLLDLYGYCLCDICLRCLCLLRISCLLYISSLLCGSCRTLIRSYLLNRCLPAIRVLSSVLCLAVRSLFFLLWLFFRHAGILAALAGTHMCA